MKIADIIFARGAAGYFYDDQKAILRGARREGFAYTGKPLTEGFEKIRIPGESVSAVLVTREGLYAAGDCCSVQYSGAGGRDPVFRSRGMAAVEKELKEEIAGREFDSFRQASDYLEAFRLKDGGGLRAAVRYGLSQAFLDAFALESRVTMAEIIAREYLLELKAEPVKIFAQCGESIHENAEKMILKGVPVIPHGLMNGIAKVGPRGEKLGEYVSWLRGRILALGGEGYKPEIHIDVYGTLGTIFNNDFSEIAGYLERLAGKASPFPLRIEGPVDAGSRGGQIDMMAGITRLIGDRGIPVEIAADEWCNTLEDIELFASAGAGHMLQIKTPDLGGIGNSVRAVLACKKHRVKPYLGGTCNETDISARVCTHAAMAARPCQMLAKPGMGFDEGYMIVYNEMKRIIAVLEAGYAG